MSSKHELQKEWARLQATAPETPRGPPTDDQRRKLTEHKDRIKIFLGGLSPEQRDALKTSKQIAKNKRREAHATKTETLNSPSPLNSVEIALDCSDNSLYSLGIKPIDFGTLQTTTNKKPVLTQSTPDYLLVLDFEATCNENPPAPFPQEIIEFPTLLLNVQTGEVEDVFHYYIRPDVHAVLSEFCTRLTGIRQSTIDHQKAVSIMEALELHKKWLDGKGLVPLLPHHDHDACGKSEQFQPQKRNGSHNDSILKDEEAGDEEKKTVSSSYLYLTCGDWDLGTCLPRQLQYHGLTISSLRQHQLIGLQRWVNVKKAF